MSNAKKSGSKSKKSASKGKKPTPTRNATEPLSADELRVEVSEAERAGWATTAAGLSEDEIAYPSPLSVLLGESVDAAKFARVRWAPVVNEKTEVVAVPGLGSAAARAAATPFSAVPRLHEGTAQEIVVLYALTQEAQTRALLSATSTGGVVHPRFEAEKLAGDLLAAADSYLDDGVENDDDARLRAVRDAHANDASTDAALAGALHDYAALAETLLPGIDGYGDFTAAWITRARELVAALRVAPRGGPGTTRTDAGLLDARNRLATLLARRLRLVRAKARFVFRDHPTVLREATSSYERRRRSATRAKKRAEKKPA